MSIWTYKDFAGQPERYWAVSRCPFCDAHLSALFKADRYREEDALQWSDKKEEVLACNSCGWWRFENVVEGVENAIDLEDYFTPRRVVRATVASLKEFDLSDVSIPVRDVRDYLSIQFGRRFEVNPRTFEETVASVFRDHGYTASVTGYTNDGGIDVILNKGDRQIGIQVKRYRHNIEVEQIRSLAGALVLSGITQGIFVTTSNFTASSKATAKRYKNTGIEVQLMNATEFYAALAIAQRQVYRSIDDFDLERLRERSSVMVDEKTETYWPEVDEGSAKAEADGKVMAKALRSKWRR